MALSSEHRDALLRDADFLRRIEAAGARLKKPETQRLAVADHLAACEALLREMRDSRIGAYSDLRLYVEAVFEWQDKASALLGPAATEEGG